jgi:hypothetical protein
MKIKSLFLAGVLAIFTLSLAVAKSYDVSFSTPTKAGTIQLKAGDYQLSLNGNKATFTEVKTQKTFTTDVTVQNVPEKFEYTKVEATTTGGSSVIKGIEIGGSKIKVDF